jgi:hypothetical protein
MTKMTTHDLVIDGKHYLPTWAVGQRITFPRIGLAEVYRIHHAGTIDVEAADGRCYRITGLRGSNWQRQEVSP